MKAHEIKTGGYYTAKVSGQLVTVRVDTIGTRDKYRRGRDGKLPIIHTVTAYHVTNMRTGRPLVFKSAQRFREPSEAPIVPPF